MSILFAIFIFVVLPVTVSILGLLLVRKYTELSTLESHNEVAGFIYAVIGVLYALLLAFVVIDVWEQYRDSQNYTELEATSLVNVCRDVEVFPDSVKSDIQENLYKYAEQMIELEFPAMYNKTTNEELEILMTESGKEFIIINLITAIIRSGIRKRLKR
jgi:phage-related holin